MTATTSAASRHVLVAVAALVALIALGAAAPAAFASSSGGAPLRVGTAPALKTIALELPLKVNAAGLAQRATEVSTPGSPLYGQYEPVSTLAREFGASSAERAHVVSFLKHAGATGVHVDATGLFADATMRVGQAQRLFGTELSTFRTQATSGAAAARYIAPSATAHVPDAIADAVTGVVGLDTQPLVRAPLVHADAAQASKVTTLAKKKATSAEATSAYPTRTGTAAGCPGALAQPGFTPNQYLTAYGYDGLHQADVKGQGERVALIEIDGFKSSDVKAFASCFGLATPRIQAFGVGIKKALPPGGESTLDLELLDAAAPSLKEVDVYESQAMASDVLRSLTEPLSTKGRTPDVISASLGSCEEATQEAIGKAGINTVQSALELAAASGITVLASSGDDGSTACVTNKGDPLNLLSVNFPASSPWVTGVGGTNIKLSAANAIADPATDQIVWNDEPALLGASGGGLSTSFDRPSYQKASVAASHREVPDVSMLADPLPGYEIYCTATADCIKHAGDNPWVTFGGTSAGTPLLAGGLALVDQVLHSRGQQSIGFANPMLYKLAHTPAAAATTIADVVLGSNDLSGAVFGRALGCCSATLGYDQASGIGSLNLTGLSDQAEATLPRQVTVGVSLPRQRKPVAAKHLLATVSCSGECLMGAYARIQIGRRGKPFTIYSSTYTLTKRRSRTIRIGLSSARVRTLRAALRKHERVRATIYGAIVDPSGSIARRSSGKTLTITG